MRPETLVVFVASMVTASGALAMSPLLGGTVVPFECEDVVEGDRLEFNDREVDGGVERRLEVRAEADSRIRLEVRSESREDGSQTRREGRMELCGFVEFSDADSDGVLDAGEIVRENVAVFEAIQHSTDGIIHTLTITGVDGSLTVTATVPAAFPDADAPLIEWTVEGSPECGPDATHFALLVERESDPRVRTFFVAECGSTLMASGEV